MKIKISVSIMLTILLVGHASAADKRKTCSGKWTDTRVIGLTLGDCDLNDVSKADRQYVRHRCVSTFSSRWCWRLHTAMAEQVQKGPGIKEMTIQTRLLRLPFTAVVALSAIAAAAFAQQPIKVGDTLTGTLRIVRATHPNGTKIEAYQIVSAPRTC